MYSTSELYNLSKDALVQLVSTIQKETEETFNKKPKLFHVSLPDDMKNGGTYVDFVCAAFTENEARLVHPSALEWISNSWIKKDEIHKLIVFEIGIANGSIPLNAVIVYNYSEY